MATWSRADQTYKPAGHWYNKPITQMADDLFAVSRQAVADHPELHAVVPVGSAWNRAVRVGLADPNPYDGNAFGQVSLWTWDQYHASAEGCYLEALIVFGTVTGLDPRNLDDKERAADDLGLNPKVAAQLREIAAAELLAQRNLRSDGKRRGLGIASGELTEALAERTSGSRERDNPAKGPQMGRSVFGVASSPLKRVSLRPQTKISLAKHCSKIFGFSALTDAFGQGSPMELTIM